MATIGAALLGVSGCSNCADWMPMREGRVWRYLDRQTAEIVEVRCDRATRIGDADGWKLVGSRGESSFAWDGCVLRSAKLSTMTFDPPVGLLQADKESAEWQYEGNATIRSIPTKVKAGLKQEVVMDEEGPGGLRVTIRFDFDGRTIELVTTFVQGVGIVSQEQRNNGVTVSSVTLTRDRG